MPFSRAVCSRQFVPRIRVAHYANARIVVQHPRDLSGGNLGAVGHRHLARVQAE